MNTNQIELNTWRVGGFYAERFEHFSVWYKRISFMLHVFIMIFWLKCHQLLIPVTCMRGILLNFKKRKVVDARPKLWGHNTSSRASMEKLYSKSIFSLSHFLSRTSLTPFDSLQSSYPPITADDSDPSLPTQEHTPSTENHTPTFSSQPAGGKTLRCNACGVTFEESSEHIAHYKSVWHTYVIY